METLTALLSFSASVESDSTAKSLHPARNRRSNDSVIV